MPEDAAVCAEPLSSIVFRESRAIVDVTKVKAAASAGGENAGVAVSTTSSTSTAPTESGSPSLHPIGQDPQAIYNLGLMYARGTGVDRDSVKAFELYEMAHAAGHVKATYNLGLMYQRGEAVAQDSARAAEFYQQAHAQGYAKATYNLAVMYERGVGVKQDSVKAAGLFQQVAAGKAETASLRTRPKKSPCVPVWVVNAGNQTSDAAKA
jgi:hypothetical protein